MKAPFEGPFESLFWGPVLMVWKARVVVPGQGFGVLSRR